ncbi:MAG: UDP-N-acetylglucosamine diphosphorylase [Verrucomicrobia bacterium]|nr:UDP-N-acetylglucosamine diphosphorylase [Verrucomicrobiota bacterium]
MNFNNMSLETSKFLDLSQTEHAALFDGSVHVWDGLKRLRDYFASGRFSSGKFTVVGKPYIDENVFIGEGTVIEEGAMILGPVLIGRNCHIRHGAYIRGCAIIGDSVVVGHSCEVKASILFNECEVPHFNYVGDSILGYKAHLGAGVKISNMKIMPGKISVRFNGEDIDTGLEKFGAIVGDYSQIGCNAVLNPGSIIGRNCVIYAGMSWRGSLPSNSIAKANGFYNIK